MKLAFPLLVLLAATSIRAQNIDWYEWDPMAVRSNRTADVALKVQITGGALTGVRLDYFGGGSLALTQTLPGIWSASVPAAKVLDGYASDDVNHNVVGFLRLLGAGGQVVSTLNLVIDVLDSSVPAVPIKNLPSSARATPRILNLFRPGLDVNQIQAAVQQFYGYYRDDFDFVQVVFTEPSYPQNRYHFAVRQDVTGIGQNQSNNAAQYGSAGKLQGITVFPIDTLFDTAESAFSHELAHQWIMFLKNASLAPGPHWPPSTMARGIMGFNIPGSSVGGDFPYTITPVSASSARVQLSTPTKEFSDLDLYLMGFLPPSAVAPMTIVQTQGCNDCVVASSTLTINDVIAVNGTRTPDWTAAKKFFRIATVVVSRDRQLTDDEMTMFDYFAARGENDAPMPYTSGLARGTTKPFSVATRGIGHVDFRLEISPRHRPAQHR